ncbi:oligosaccharide flippase family protein [Aneurinibacillus sp. REN35]|uniref:oligosaccharide flippase family protein n=1 Tax=Aneurinibacillus sp. REN35 TaxID=3237286 RepID=UPI0035297742
MAIPVFFRQLALRTSAIFVVKLMGALIRIPLFRLLGAEGVGLYQMAYSFYGLVLTFIMGGFPTALSLLTAKDARKGKTLTIILLVCLAFVGSCAAYLTYIFAPRIALFMGDQKLTVAIQYIAPALFTVPLLHLIRGYLQGIEYYGYIAGSEVIEQLVRVCTMLGLVTLWMMHGEVWTVGGAVFGAFSGAVCALLFLLFPLRVSFQVSNNERTTQSLFIGFPIFLHSALAILATRLVVPVSEFLDALIIPHRLQDGGMSITQATAVFGEISGMAVTAVYVPTIVTAAISHTLSSKVAEDWKSKKYNAFSRKSRLTIQLTWGWGIVSLLFLFFYAYEISTLLFGNDEVGRGIRYLCAVPLLTGIREVTTTILWSQEREKEPIMGLILGIVCSVILAYFLVAIPGYGYEGAALSILSLECVAAIWNVVQIKKMNNGIFLIFPALWEAICILVTGVLYFFLLSTMKGAFFHTLPIFVQEIGAMALFGGGMAVYIGIRFLKKNRYAIY